MAPASKSTPVDCEVVSFCAPNHTQKVHKRPPGGKFVGANICETVVGRQFAPQPYRTGGGGIWPFNIYWLGVETPNERNESS
jgi:hypothetical protein